MNCPECEEEFKNERGVRTHYSMVHSGNLDNNECNKCSKPFYSKDTSKKYCDNCFSFEGEMNPNYKDSKLTSDCYLCGSSFEYYPSSKDGIYCSDCQKSRPWVTSEDAPEPPNNDKSIELNCDFCDKDIVKPPSEINKYNFCSINCMGNFRSERYTGSGHPNWEENYPNRYTGDWLEVKNSALKRDNHRCQKCGKEKEEIGQEPDVHHITPVKEFDDQNEAHKLSNVICLCRSCHMEEES